MMNFDEFKSTRKPAFGEDERDYLIRITMAYARHARAAEFKKTLTWCNTALTRLRTSVRNKVKPLPAVPPTHLAVNRA